MRIQIQLTDEQSRSLEAMARDEGISTDDLIRRCIERFLLSGQQAEQEELKRRSLSIIGKYSSGHDDVATNHDKYLADIYLRLAALSQPSLFDSG